MEVRFLPRLQVSATAFSQGSARAAFSSWSRHPVGNLVPGMLRSIESAVPSNSQLVCFCGCWRQAHAFHTWVIISLLSTLSRSICLLSAVPLDFPAHIRDRVHALQSTHGVVRSQAMAGRGAMNVVRPDNDVHTIQRWTALGQCLRGRVSAQSANSLLSWGKRQLPLSWRFESGDLVLTLDILDIQGALQHGYNMSHHISPMRAQIPRAPVQLGQKEPQPT